MNAHNSIYNLTLVAAAAIEAHRFVQLDGTKSGAGEYAGGVSVTEAATDEPFPVAAIGSTPVMCGGAFAKGDALEADADGKAVLRTTGTIVARALGVGVLDNTAEVMLIQN